MNVKISKAVKKEFIQENIKTQLLFYFPEISKIEFSDSYINLTLHNKVKANVIEEINKKTNILVEKFDVLNKFASQQVLYNSNEEVFTDQWKRNFYNFNKKNFVIAANKMIHFLSDKLKRELKSRNQIIGNVTSIQEGLNVYANSSVVVYEGLNILLKTYFELEYNAQDLIIPSMIPTSIIKKSGYFDSGCQHISFVSPINNEPHIYSEVSQYLSNHNESYDQLQNFLKQPTNILNPALCLHCYPILEEEILDIDEIQTFTVFGSCFRNESGNLNNEERLKEFSMREVVFFANEDNLKKIHTNLKVFSVLFAELFELDFKLANSHDIFFNENATKQLFSQVLSDDKIELVVHMKGENKSFSIASINKHHNHFSSRFNIKNNESELVSSMCIGFGFNRIIYALENKLHKGLGSLVQDLKDALSKLECSESEVN